MNVLAQKVIDLLKNEEDSDILQEILDFYQYLKEKKDIQLEEMWQRVSEDKATYEEINLIREYEEQYKAKNIRNTISLEDLNNELGLND